MRRPNFYRGFGLHAYASASSATWFTLNAADSSEAINVGAAGIGVSGYREIINQDIGEDNSVAVLLDVGLAYRGLFGDVASQEVDSIRIRTLGTKKEHFLGIELGLTIQVNAIRAGLGFFFFGPDARGLSDGQLVAAFSLQGALLSWTGKRQQ